MSSISLAGNNRLNRNDAPRGDDQGLRSEDAKGKRLAKIKMPRLWRNPGDGENT